MATVGAAHFHTGEPWSFLIALAIAVIKAVLVVLFFMHLKDASRVAWVFCGCSFVWLGLMVVLTFQDQGEPFDITKLNRPLPPEALRKGR